MKEEKRTLESKPSSALFKRKNKSPESFVLPHAHSVNQQAHDSMTDQLGQISIQMARAIIPVIIVAGVAGNLINIAVLTRSTLYHHSCSRYFLMLSICGLAYTSINLTYRLLVDGYQVDPARSSTFACKAITFITQLCYPMAPYFIVLTSIDRFCASSSNARIRTFSNSRVSRKAIVIVFSFFVLLYANTAVIVDLQPSDGLGCRNRGNSTYKQLYAIVQCVLFAIVAPTLMALFGLLTICNAKQAAGGRILTSRHRRTERQLVAMLLVQVGTHILLSLPVAILYPMIVLPTAYKATRLVFFAYSMATFPLHLSYATAFPLYFLSARIYRKEFLRLFKRLMRHTGSNQIIPMETSFSAVPAGVDTVHTPK